MAEPQTSEGQAASADPAGTTAAAPDASDGQSAAENRTTEQGSGQASGESFFDPKSIEHSPELMQAYKQMQGKFTKSMQGIRAAQQKVDMYDRAMADPVGTVRQLAQQYGMTVVDGQPQGDQAFNPQSWDDVTDHIRSQVTAELQQQYEPLLGEVRTLKQQSIEQQLDAKYADWRVYESDMIKTLQAHPSMANDPDGLYRMSVPLEVQERRATERALAKLKGSTDSASVSGSSTTTQPVSEKPSGKLSFDDAVKFARESLRKQGLSRPIG